MSVEVQFIAVMRTLLSIAFVLALAALAVLVMSDQARSSEPLPVQRLSIAKTPPVAPVPHESVPAPSVS